MPDIAVLCVYGTEITLEMSMTETVVTIAIFMQSRTFGIFYF